MLAPQMELREEEEDVLSEMKRRLEDEDLDLDQRVLLLNKDLNKLLHTHSSVLTAVKTQLFVRGILSHCVRLLTPSPRMHRGNWTAITTLAQLTSSCCEGAEPGEHSQAFHRLLLPSLMDGLLSLASQLLGRGQGLFRTVMDSVVSLLRRHSQLTAQVLSSLHYENIQMSDDVTVTLLCVHMWINICTGSRDFLSGLGDDSVMLLLNEAVGQLAVSAESSVGGACVRLILLMANQQERRVRPLLLSFRGLDSLLDKDWRGRGFDEDVEQLIGLIQSSGMTRTQAACVIQAAWRSCQTRRRVKSLNRAASALQARFRARRRQRLQEEEEQHWEEELKYQVCVRRQQARREFHEKQRRLLQLVPADQVQVFLQDCERRAAVVIQSSWRGFRERRRYAAAMQRHAAMQRRQQAAMTLQRAARRFLHKRRAAKGPPTTSLWIGQSGLTDSRRAELKRQVEQHVAQHPSSLVSRQECVRLLQEVQRLLLTELQRGDAQRREEQREEALLAHTHTQLELLRDAPPLSVVTTTDADSFQSPSSGVSARARDSHNATLQAGRLPWWRTLGDAVGPAHLQGLEAEPGSDAFWDALRAAP